MLMTYIAKYFFFFFSCMVTGLEYLIYSLFGIQKDRLICKVTDKTFLAESLKLFHNATCNDIPGPISI